MNRRSFLRTMSLSLAGVPLLQCTGSAGRYAITLSRYPLHLKRPIQAAHPAGGPIPGGVPFPKGKDLPITNARIRIQKYDRMKSVAADDAGATFKVQLKAGDCMLKTFMMDGSGFDRGAYFVNIEKLK